MFVSSYSTYISPNSNDKTNRYKDSNLQDKTESFTLKQSKSPLLLSHLNKSLPIDYVSNYKSFNNQQKLQEQIKSQDEIKLQKMSAMNSAKTAYEDNSKMFSLIKKPSLSLDQSEKTDNILPKEIQDLKEKNLRHKMVNTYISNDKYYQITA